MANLFKTNTLVLTKQSVSATGNNLYVNSVAVGDLISGNLTATGAALIARDLATSGALQSQISAGGVSQATLNATGALITSLSGWAASATALASTGQQAWGAAQANGTNLSGNLGVTGSSLDTRIMALSGWARSVERLCISFNPATQTTWTNMNGPQEFFNRATGNAIYMDLTAYTGVQLVVNKMAVTGANFSALYLGYNGAFQTVPANYLSLETTPVRARVNVQNAIIQSGWNALTVGARSGVYVALLGSGGVTTTSPTFGRVDAYFM